MNIKDMIRGWFVGDFEPSAFKTDKCEVAYKKYKEGDIEEKHYHKIATEITLVSNGIIEMNGIRYWKGDIVIVHPNEVVAFKSITDSENIVVKVPCAKNDKYTINT